MKTRSPIALPVPQLLAASLLALGLAGCASGPGYAEYRRTLPPPPEGQTRVWFYRPSMLGAAVQPAVKLDGRSVGSAVPRGFFHVETEPGTHEVSITTEWTHKAQINPTTNSETYVRLNMALGFMVGHVVPVEVTPEKAARDLGSLRHAKP